MKPNVSIVVPIYNVERYLFQCLNTLVKQSLKNIEIICVNDGSTDSCQEIINNFKLTDNRIKVVKTDNYGYGHAMNIGLSLVKGDYIGIVEPDDYVEYNMFERLYRDAKRYRADIVKSDFYRFTGDKNMIKTYQQVFGDENGYYRPLNPQIQRECFRSRVNIWCGIYKKELVFDNKIRFHESPGAAFQDNGFWFQTLCYASSILFIDVPLYHNRRDNPQSSVNRKDNIYCCNEEYLYIKELILNHSLLGHFKKEYGLKKWETYKFNLDRMHPAERKEYIECIGKEFREDIKGGYLDQEVFNHEEWNEISEVMYGRYQFVNLKKQNNLCKSNKVFSNLKKWWRQKDKNGKL